MPKEEAPNRRAAIQTTLGEAWLRFTEEIQNKYREIVAVPHWWNLLEISLLGYWGKLFMEKCLGRKIS